MKVDDLFYNLEGSPAVDTITSIDCPKLGRDVGLFFIGHLIFGNVDEGAPFCASPLDLESDIHCPQFVEPWAGHLRPTRLIDRPHCEELEASLAKGYRLSCIIF